MSNKLQAKLKLLAEKAGENPPWDHETFTLGEDDSLRTEDVGLVLGWLREADYKTADHKSGLTIQEFKKNLLGSKGQFRTVASGEGDNLPAALVHAVLVLPLPG